MLKNYKLANIYQGRLETGDDLLKELTRLVRERNIKTGKISAIGATSKARLSFYDQEMQEYEDKEFNQSLEIVNVSGNISLKDGEPLVHAHITLGDEDGKLYGGHLVEGTIIFACEFIIEEYKGDPLERGMHKETGLPLWKK